MAHTPEKTKQLLGWIKTLHAAAVSPHEGFRRRPRTAEQIAEAKDGLSRVTGLEVAELIAEQANLGCHYDSITF